MSVEVLAIPVAMSSTVPIHRRVLRTAVVAGCGPLVVTGTSVVLRSMA